MKFLTVLSVLQLAAITVLSFKLVAVERSIDASMLTSSSPADTTLDTRAPAGSAAMATPATIGPNLEQLRNIVREELATALSTFTPASPTHTVTVAHPTDSSSKQAPDYQYPLAVVASEIDYHVSQGFISGPAMIDLQKQFATLDQSGRKQMMRKLVKALNSGDLKGQL
jgi:hypothetical protein